MNRRQIEAVTALISAARWASGFGNFDDTKYVRNIANEAEEVIRDGAPIHVQISEWVNRPLPAPIGPKHNHKTKGRKA